MFLLGQRSEGAFYSVDELEVLLVGGCEELALLVEWLSALDFTLEFVLH